MLRRVLRRVVGRSDEGADENGDDETEDSRFVPSRLDASVRYAHGGSAEEIDREMARIEATAKVLEERRSEE